MHYPGSRWYGITPFAGIRAHRYPSAVAAYDYAITIGDELDFVWQGRRGIATWLFFLNRFAMLAQIILSNLPFYGLKVCGISLPTPRIPYACSARGMRVDETVQGHTETLTWQLLNPKPCSSCHVLCTERGPIR